MTTQNYWQNKITMGLKLHSSVYWVCCCYYFTAWTHLDYDKIHVLNGMWCYFTQNKPAPCLSTVVQISQKAQLTTKGYVASPQHKSIAEEADSLTLNWTSTLQSWSAISLMLLMLIAMGDDWEQCSLTLAHCNYKAKFFCGGSPLFQSNERICWLTRGGA